MTQSDTKTAGAPQTAGIASEQIESATSSATPPSAEPQSRPVEDLVEDDLLVEDVSIDGMCGVY